jgi:DNA-binding MarR family transcriptional regulator
MADQPTIRFVPHLPDLMERDDYVDDGTAPGERTIKVRISVTPEGVAILADTQHPVALEELLARLGAREIELMLCG